MKKSTILAWILLPILFHAVPPADAGEAQAFPQELEADLSAGATAIYNLDFKAAEAHFDRAIQVDPDHPAAFFFKTMSLWYRLTYDSLLNKDPQLERAIQDQADRTIAVAKRFAKDPDTRAAGFLYLGGGLGAKGWYYVSRGQFVRAYFSGKKGYNYLRKGIDDDPELYDAYLGIGMYEYYAATLGPVLKVLSSFFIHGDRDQAVRDLLVAETESRYVRLEAAYFLWNSYLDEGRLVEAREKIDFLTRTFPESPLFRWGEIQTLFFGNRWDEVLKKGEAYAARAAARQGPNALLLAKVYYHCGAAALNRRKLELAKSYFEKAANEPAEFDGWKTLAWLRLGELEDLKGRRQEALEYYRRVSAAPRVWDAHKLARSRARHPFTMDQLSNRAVAASPLQLWRNDDRD